MQFLTFWVELTNTPEAQIIRSFGYLSSALLFATILFFPHTMHPRWFHILINSNGVHMTLVSVWSAMLANGLSVPTHYFNSILSVTTGGMVLSFGAFVGHLLHRRLRDVRNFNGNVRVVVSD